MTVPSLSDDVSVKLALRSVAEAEKPAVGATLGALAVTTAVALSLSPSSSVTVSCTS